MCVIYLSSLKKMVVHKSWLSLGYTVAAAAEKLIICWGRGGGKMRTRWWGRKSENQEALRCFWFSFLLCPALVEFPTHNNNNNWNRECRCRRDGFPVDTPAFKKKKKKRKKEKEMCCAAQSVHSQDLSPADDANAVLLWSQREKEKKINKYFLFFFFPSWL